MREGTCVVIINAFSHFGDAKRVLKKPFLLENFTKFLVFVEKIIFSNWRLNSLLTSYLLIYQHLIRDVEKLTESREKLLNIWLSVVKEDGESALVDDEKFINELSESEISNFQNLYENLKKNNSNLECLNLKKFLKIFTNRLESNPKSKDIFQNGNVFGVKVFVENVKIDIFFEENSQFVNCASLNAENVEVIRCLGQTIYRNFRLRIKHEKLKVLSLFLEF